MEISDDVDAAGSQRSRCAPGTPCARGVTPLGSKPVKVGLGDGLSVDPVPVAGVAVTVSGGQERGVGVERQRDGHVEVGCR